MQEQYKFAGFSADSSMYVEVGRYCFRLLEKVIENLHNKSEWHVTTNELLAAEGRDEMLLRHFAMSPETVVIFCKNLRAHRGVRLQIDDPVAADRETAVIRSCPSYKERPAALTSFMDEFDEPGEDLFSQDLVIFCELSLRTERIIKELVIRYVCDALSYEEMSMPVQYVNSQEEEIWKKWKAERGIEPEV